jgi:hypothetical protein
MLTRSRRAAQRAWRYVRHELPELVVPASMPDPPHVAAAAAAARKRPRLTPREHAQVSLRALRAALSLARIGRQNANAARRG